MINTYPGADGRLYNRPTTPQMAIDNGQQLYTDLNGPCPSCNEPTPTRYVMNDECLTCLRIAASMSDEPTDRASAIKNKKKSYQTNIPCRSGPHLIMRSLKTGRCVLCEVGKQIKKQQAKTAAKAAYKPRNARSAARAAGLWWYTPETPCERCGKIAERHVQTNVCRGCRAIKDRKPMLVFEGSRGDAVTLGFRMFRDGTLCRRGHKRTRYVTASGCLECLRGEST